MLKPEELQHLKDATSGIVNGEKEILDRPDFLTFNRIPSFLASLVRNYGWTIDQVMDYYLKTQQNNG